MEYKPCTGPASLVDEVRLGLQRLALMRAGEAGLWGFVGFFFVQFGDEIRLRLLSKGFAKTA